MKTSLKDNCKLKRNWKVWKIIVNWKEIEWPNRRFQILPLKCLTLSRVEILLSSPPPSPSIKSRFLITFSSVAIARKMKRVNSVQWRRVKLKERSPNDNWKSAQFSREGQSKVGSIQLRIAQHKSFLTKNTKKIPRLTHELVIKNSGQPVINRSRKKKIMKRIEIHTEINQIFYIKWFVHCLTRWTPSEWNTKIIIFTKCIYFITDYAVQKRRQSD